jgi:metal-sulfur cluster biosynthetic enzyme
MEITEKGILESLEQVIDPELGVNIVAMGLVYNVQIEGNKISVDMTLTNRGCPLAGMLAGSAEQAIRESFPEADVEISVVWDPPWTPDMMSEEAKQHLGRTG